MKNLKKSGFALVLSMMLVLVIVLVAMVVLEIAIPFSRNIKGIENSSNAYYQANTGVEGALWFVSKNTVGVEDSKLYVGNSIDSKYDIKAKGAISPIPGKGDSDFDKNWSKISQGSPIQMEVGNNVLNGADPKAYFRVPNFSLNSGGSVLKLSGNNSIINWQLSGDTQTLNASAGSYFTADNICKSNDNNCDLSPNTMKLNDLDGNDLDGNNITFQVFYNSNCGSGKSCILKLSVINKLTIDNNVTIPYLEWKIDFGSDSVPTRVAEIDVSGKSYGFRKDISVGVPQKTLNDSFDFTIFQ